MARRKIKRSFPRKYSSTLVNSRASKLDVGAWRELYSSHIRSMRPMSVGAKEATFRVKEIPITRGKFLQGEEPKMEDEAVYGDSRDPIRDPYLVAEDKRRDMINQAKPLEIKTQAQGFTMQNLIEYNHTMLVPGFWLYFAGQEWFFIRANKNGTYSRSRVFRTRVEAMRQLYMELLTWPETILPPRKPPS